MNEKKDVDGSFLMIQEPMEKITFLSQGNSKFFRF